LRFSGSVLKDEVYFLFETFVAGETDVFFFLNLLPAAVSGIDKPAHRCHQHEDKNNGMKLKE
jgi:hypothetical protein